MIAKCPACDQQLKTTTAVLLENSMDWKIGVAWNFVSGFLAKRRSQRRTRKCAFSGIRAGFEQYEDRRMLAVFTVNSMLDNGDNANTTLREALDAASLSSDAEDTINFDETVFGSGGTIVLTSGALSISESDQLFIDGRDSSGTPLGIKIDAGGGTNGVVGNFDGHTVLSISGSGDVEINGLELTGGDTSGNGGAISSSYTSLTVKNSVITGNAAQGGGGGIASAGNLTIQNSTVSDNTAIGPGGGIDFDSSFGELNVVSSEISLNESLGNGGGGIRITGELNSQNAYVTIQSSLITGNRAVGTGGGVRANLKNLSIDSTIFHDNSFEINDVPQNGRGGGGLFVSATGGSISIDKSVFDANETNGYTGFNGVGGGAYINAIDSTVTITNTSVTNNKAIGTEANVGGLNITASNESEVVLDRVNVIGNRADDDVGGLQVNNDNSSVTVRNTTISGNTAYENYGSDYDGAGGVWISAINGGTNIIENSTISGNRILNNSRPNYDSGKRGGGLLIKTQTGATTTILNSTISGNEAEGSGGGIKISEVPLQSGGLVDIRHSTITNNRSDSNGDNSGAGGGIHIGSSTTTVTLDHTIVARNWSGPGEVTRDDISGEVTVAWSLIGDDVGATIDQVLGTTNQIGTLTTVGAIDPHLAPLANNGGLTQTHALLSNSTAIDAGNSSAVAGSSGVPLYDQRGEPFSRVLNAPGINGNSNRIDIGAYELGTARVVDVVLNGIMLDQDDDPWTRGPISFAELVSQGKQFAPIYVDGVNSIQIVFSGPVDLDAGALTLVRDHETRGNSPVTVSEIDFDEETFTWTFDVLGGFKYRIDMAAAGVLDEFGRTLDGYWANDHNDTFDDWTDDPEHNFATGLGLGGSPFQFLFALLSGDYNQDGEVDSADNLVYAQGKVDGNGDGINSTADHDVYVAHSGDYLQLRRRSGDYNDDEAVGLADYSFWRAHYGETQAGQANPDIPHPADGNNNGLVDAADYTTWRYFEDSIGAWSSSPHGLGSLIPIVDFANAPQVANVTISGSSSTHDPYSFDDHDGSGEQLRTVPVGGADTVSITFTEDVNVVADNLRLLGLLTSDVPELVDFAYDMLTMTATWQFEELVVFDHYLISLSDVITDIEGNRLDGEWVNPASLVTTNALVSEFPSGDGHSGGNFSFVFTLLAGDANLNNETNNWDYYIFEDQWGVWGAGDFEDGDFDGDGYITEADFALYDLSYQTWDLSNPYMRADLNGDFVVDDDDLDILASNIGVSNPPYGDLNFDNQVDSADLDLLMAFYGCELDVAS